MLTSVTPKVLDAPAFHVTLPVLDEAEPEKKKVVNGKDPVNAVAVDN